MVMRPSSSFVAPFSLALLSIALLCGPAGRAMSQTATGATSLPGVTVIAPQQAARPLRPAPAARPERAAPRPQPAASREPAPAAVASRSTAPAPAPAQNSVMARLAALERTSGSCLDGCQSSFKRGNAPWHGCSLSGDVFSTTCRNPRNYKSYLECRETGLFLGWRHNDVRWYCSSLDLAGYFKVADARRGGR
jgi:hypothetical protein